MKIARRTLALRSLAALVGLMGIAGCAGGDPGNSGSNAEPVAARDTAHAMMPGTGSMPGMQVSMDTSRTMERMEAHMRAMEGASADSVQAMLPMHQRMVSNMIAQLNRDMGNMNMSGDTAWTATVDSVQRDLTRMPSMSSSELQQFTPGHHGRVTRLMGMRRAMGSR